MTAAQSMCRPLQAHAAPRRHSFKEFVTVYKEWRRRARGRAELAALSEPELRDIGLTRYDAQHEIGKPFWRA